jgi:hypothetical protein
MVVGIVGFAFLPALASGWQGNLQDLQIALSGLLQLLGFASVGVQAANVDPITVGHSVSITSAISRLLGPDAPTSRALLISGAIALLLVGVIVQIYRATERPLLRWPNAAAQAAQPYLGIVALEWMALMTFALAFSPQTNPRHTSLLLMVSAPPQRCCVSHGRACAAGPWSRPRRSWCSASCSRPTLCTCRYP